MSDLKFTKEEKQQIRKSLKTVVKDMRSLWKIYPYEEVDIPIYVQDSDLNNYGCSWYLLMDSKRIIMYSQSTRNYTNLERHRIHHLQDLRYTIGDYIAHFQFINKYDQIKESLLKVLSERKAKQQKNIDSLIDIEKRHNSKNQKEKEKLAATVQIDLPQTQNRHEIEISEEDGKKVGRIDFGAQTIKFITEGDIVLVNKQEKVKRK